MSVTFMNIGCDQCEFDGSSLVTSGCYLWRHEDCVFQFERQLGLCLDCNKIVAIEEFPDNDTMIRARAIHKSYTGQPLLRFLEEDYAKYLASQKGFAILETVIELKRLPVCLECGKSAVRKVQPPKELTEKTKVSLGLGHPWCAGILYAQSSGSLRMGITPITYTYDIYGRLISTTYD